MNPEVKYKPARLFYDSYTPEECDDSLSPLVFVHGLCGLHTSWNRVWKRIADQTRRKAFVIDLRNHGDSEWNDVFELDALATDIENFARENGLKKCCFVSHSIGGKICLRVAMLMPELVDRLVVEEVPLRNPYPEEKEQFETMMKVLRKLKNFPKNMTEKQIRSLLSNYAATQLQGYGIRDMAFNLPLRRNQDGSFGLNANIDTIDRCFADGSAYSINHQKGMEFYGPALIIFSKASPFKLDQDMVLKEFFPNAKLLQFQRLAHVLHIECVDEYVENVSMFLNTLEVQNNS